MPTSVPTREVYWNIQGIWIMYALLVVTAVVFGYGAWRHYQLVRAGKPENRFDRPGERLKALLGHALAQGRTLSRKYAGLSHVAFSWGFVILFLGTVVVFIHEDLGAISSAFQIMQGGFYLWFQSLTLDLFGVAAIVAVGMALLRRSGVVARRDRLYQTPADPRTLLDDGLILGGFLVILVTGFLIEGARIVATG